MNIRRAASPSQWGRRVSEDATENRRILVDRDPYAVPSRAADRAMPASQQASDDGDGWAPATRIVLLPAWLHGEGCATLPVRYPSLAMSTLLAFGMLLVPGTYSGGSANPRRSGR
jgi:hypothetical protein